MIKLLIITIFTLAIPLFSFAAQPAVFAGTAPGFELCDGVAAETQTCKDVKAQEADGSNPVIANLKIALNLLAFVAGAAAVIILIVNGLRLILSNGDAAGVNSARSGLIYVVVGLIVVVIAKAIVVFLLDNI